MISGSSSPLTSDVCVVGAGPAGITLAHVLGRAGRTVTVLESGGAHDDPFAQELNDGDAEGEPYAGLRETRYRGLGGTPNIWNVEVEGSRGAKYVPLDPCDLESWPLGWSDLEPFYREAQKICGLGPFAYDAETWGSEGARPFDLRGTGLTSAVYQFGVAARFTRELMAELRGMDNVRVLPSATVVGLLTDGTGRHVLGVQVVDESGTAVEVRAKRVVLACGAVENARLLLLASVGGYYHSEWVGRGFMEHARDFSLSLVPDSPARFSEAAFYDLRTAACGTRIGGRLALLPDAIERFDLPNASMTLIPKRGEESRPTRMQRLLRRWVGASKGGNRYGWSRRPARAQAFEAFRIVLNFEQRPDFSNRIALSSRRDHFGNPLPQLYLQWTDEEQDRLDRLRELLSEWFRTSGLGSLRFERGRRPNLSAHHHAGTTRMADHPENGVVDSDGAVFGLENLYVTGGSVFPTAGFANPTLTIVALACRLARHLASRDAS